MKKFLTSTLFFIFLASLFVFSAKAAVISGNCGANGDNVKWNLDTESGTLTISGQGEMKNYAYYSLNQPWASNIESITSVVIQDGVTSIGNSAFASHNNLVSITIPKSIKTIGSDAFKDCILSSVEIVDLAAWCETKFVNEDSSPFFYNKTTLYVNGESITTDLIIPDGVTEIQQFAFKKLPSLMSVTIPSSLKKVGKDAFSTCTNLSFVDISDFSAWCQIDFESASSNPLCNGGKLFVNGKKLTNIVIPEEITNIKNYTFVRLAGVSSVTIPDSVVSIGDNSFGGCSDLVDVSMSHNIKTIGCHAFNDCTNLSNIAIPSSVLEMGEYAFNGCKNLTVEVNDLSAWCKIKFGYDANPLHAGAKLVVNGKEVIDELIIPEGTTMISDSAFSGLESVTSVTIHDGVTSIGEHAFSVCTQLKSITIPDSVTTIGRSAFYLCKNLRKATIGKGIQTMYQVFDNCGLSAIYISDLSAWCKINFKEDFCGYYTPNHFLYLNGTSVEQLVLPSDIKTIPSYAFSKTANIKSVVIPTNIRTISQGAFYNCNNITEIYYTGTADEWERVRIADNNGSLSTATVYTDYVPDAMKITFSANTTDAVSSLPDAASAIGSYKLPATVPVRTGYKFLGWSTVPDGKAAYQPGDTVEISADTTFYAVWAEADKVALSGITLKNTAYEPISSIPTGDFIAEVTLTNNTYTASCTVLLTTYDADGRMLDVRYLYADPDAGKTITFGTGLSDPNGKIAKIKAFVLSDLRAFTILGEAAELTKA